MLTHGFHLLLDVWLKEEINQSLTERLANYVRRRFTVVAEVQKTFEPYGLTQVLVLSESHFSIHTYPEHRYLSMDLYICNPAVDLEKVRDEILSLLQVRKCQSSLQARGREPKLSLVGSSRLNSEESL